MPGQVILRITAIPALSHWVVRITNLDCWEGDDELMSEQEVSYLATIAYHNV